jgi:uncharacterized membrane protein YgcG
MRPKFRKGVLLLPLFFLGYFFGFSMVSAQDKTDVTVAVKQARDSGVPENVLSQMLAFGYKYDLKATEMANFVNITRKAKEENFPIEPLVSKLEEGLAKRVQAQIIERVLRQQLSHYRFARRVAYKAMNRWGVPTQSLKPGELARLSKTLSMGISKQEMEGFFAHAPKAPITEITDALELMAALKQSRLQTKMSEEIVISGLKKGFFSKTAWNLPLMVDAAKSKKISNQKIRAAAIEVVSGKKSVFEAHTELGLDPKDLARGPQFLRSPSENIGKGKGTGHGAGHSGGMGNGGGMGGGAGGPGGPGGGGGSH